MVTFTKVQQPVKYVKYSELQPGDHVASGTLLKINMVPGYGGIGTVPQYELLTLEHETVIVNSAGHLDYLMGQKPNKPKGRIPQIGDYIEIIYMGRNPVVNPRTGKMGPAETAPRNFEVGIANENPEIYGNEDLKGDEAV